MDKIIVVDCVSTSMIYLKDAIEMGMEPVILETWCDNDPKVIARRKANYAYLEVDMPRIIQGCEKYEDTLELVRKENPLLVLPGAEMSVEMATRLANDLGLRCNDSKNLPKMTRKSEMHNALKDAGLRYIHGQMVANVDEALDFWESIGRRDVVIKPTHSAGAVDVHMCSTSEQIKVGVEDIIGKPDMFGTINDKALIQERIHGTEYIVNTVTCKGVSYVTACYRYQKYEIPGGAMLYDMNENILEQEMTPEIENLMEYAKNVIKAIGIEFGPVHGEYMMDEEGPVLVEVNCRICGGDMTSKFLETMWGHHETDRSLEAYLDDKKFDERVAAGYKSKGKGYYKLLRVMEPMDIVDAPIYRIAKAMPSFIFCKGLYENKKMHLPKTVNLYTNGGKIALASEDIDQAKRDYEELTRIVNEEYDTLYTLA